MKNRITPKAQEALDSVIEKFKTGDLGDITEAALIPLSPDAPARNRTWANIFLAYLQTGEVDCRTLKQWNEVGRRIRKGAKASYILGPNTIKEDVKNEKGDTEEKERCIGFHSIAVFPGHNTEGDEPLPAYKPAEYPPLYDVARRLNVEVDYFPTAPAVYGAYRPTAGTITLGTHNTDVFFHELAHAAHHKCDPDFNKRSKEEKEVVAEFTAAVLMRIYGYDHSKSAWEYIKAFSDDPMQAIRKALNTVGDVLALILKDETLEDETDESQAESYQRLATIAA